MADEEQIFTKIYDGNLWQSSESVSGPGSSLASTEALRKQLPELFARLNIRSLVDAPCGDLNWMKKLDFKFEQYIGIDIVKALIEKLREQDLPSTYHFQHGNIVTDILPKADAIFCRDCLVHLPFDAIKSAVNLWRRAGFRYMVVTHFFEWPENKDCSFGGWRPLNFLKAPFEWDPPLEIVVENPALVGRPYGDKSMAIWKLNY